MNNEQRIVKFSTVAGDSSLSGTVSFEESVPLSQQSIAVKQGLQPNADNDVTDAAEPGYSLAEQTIFLYPKFYTEAITHSLE